MLLLDNCSSHTLSDEEKSNLPKRLFSFFLPQNVANKHQPAEMGIIVIIKVGYIVIFLEKLLYIFDIEGGYLRAYSERTTQIENAR